MKKCSGISPHHYSFVNSINEKVLSFHSRTVLYKFIQLLYTFCAVYIIPKVNSIMKLFTCEELDCRRQIIFFNSLQTLLPDENIHNQTLWNKLTPLFHNNLFRSWNDCVRSLDMLQPQYTTPFFSEATTKHRQYGNPQPI